MSPLYRITVARTRAHRRRAEPHSPGSSTGKACIVAGPNHIRPAPQQAKPASSPGRTTFARVLNRQSLHRRRTEPHSPGSSTGKACIVAGPNHIRPAPQQAKPASSPGRARMPGLDKHTG
ncbi:hypothetical protein PJP10_16385 [Mycobacterium kansasii]